MSFCRQLLRWRVLRPICDRFPFSRLRLSRRDRHPSGMTQTFAALDGAPVGPSIGEGLDIRLSGANIAGTALVREGRLVHAELFRRQSRDE